MPLYMDIHTVDSENFSVEDVVIAHFKDLAIQKKFGVIHHKYWIDADNKKIFCLVEAPSKEACNFCHEAAHGGTACNIIEVSDDEYNFLNIGKSKNDLAQTPSGEIDPGFRTFLSIDTIDLTGKYKHYTKKTHEIIRQYKGFVIVQPDENIMVSFTDTANAIVCAIAIEKLLKSILDNYEYRLTLVTGHPVDVEGENLFEETKKKIKTICKIGSMCKIDSIKAIYIDTVTKSIIDNDPNAPELKSTKFKIIKPNEFLMLERMFAVFNSQLYKSDFNLKKLNMALGLSRAQSYRKIKSITCLAPNQLIQELRLRQSIILLKQNAKTIAEIAYDLGYNSPTYFTQVFRNRFDITPTSYVKLHS